MNAFASEIAPLFQNLMSLKKKKERKIKSITASIHQSKKKKIPDCTAQSLMHDGKNTYRT